VEDSVAFIVVFFIRQQLTEIPLVLEEKLWKILWKMWKYSRRYAKKSMV